MVKKCEKCEVHFDEKDLFLNLCRECVVETDHDCRGEKCEVCAFINFQGEEGPIEDMNEETREEIDYNIETHGK